MMMVWMLAALVAAVSALRVDMDPPRSNGYESRLGSKLSYRGFSGGRAVPLCGMKSKFSRKVNDRTFEPYYCKVESKYRQTDGALTWMVDTDGGQRRLQCESDKVVVSIEAPFRRNERTFSVGCQRFKDTEMDLGSCSTWRSAFERDFDHKCPRGKVLVSLETEVDDYKSPKDGQRFTFTCCPMVVDWKDRRRIATHSWTSYRNGWDDTFLYTAPSAICGWSSKHSNHHEDRQFRFKACYPKGVSPRKSGQLRALGWTSYDGSWRKECRGGHEVLRAVASKHKNSKEDRKFNFYCQEYSNGKRDSGTTRWSSYVNEYDGSFDFACGDGYVLAGVASKHSNRHEDRKFKFKCSRWTFAL